MPASLWTLATLVRLSGMHSIPDPRIAMSHPRQSKPESKSHDAAPKLPVKKGAGGRPPKYSGPSRPVTLTLPESTLEGLQQIHADRGQAIVKLTEAALRTGPASQAQVEIVQMADNTGLLVVGPSKALRRIPFLHLIEVAPGRFLIAMDPGNDYRSLEIALRDVLDVVAKDDPRERELITQLLEQISHLRKSARMRMAEILFVELTQKGKKATLHSLMSTVGWFLSSAA